MTNDAHIAIDLGAESGRVISGFIDGDILRLKEIYRFPNEMIFKKGHLRWDIGNLFDKIIAGLEMAVSDKSIRLVSVGIDTWGVDFGLLGNNGDFIDMPITYRDRRTENITDSFFELITQEKLYQLTGVQILQINSLFQLYSIGLNEPDNFKQVKDFLFMPDIFNYLLTGKKQTEFSIATTSQIYNPTIKNWDTELINILDLDIEIFQKVVEPATMIGPITTDKFEDLQDLPVYSVVSHDTGSAVAAIPSIGNNWAFISSGTWSLMGIEIDKPIINQKSFELNFTNEGGINGTFRFLKNITGLWILQQCKKQWDKESRTDYSELSIMASNAKSFQAFIDPDHNGFLNPENMLIAINEYCNNTKQSIRNDIPTLVRIILESLALKYRYILDQLRQVAENQIDVIHVIGGGSKSELLCQFTANACGIPVCSGPVEATATGNILVQAMAMNKISSLDKMRNIVKNSMDLKIYEPENINLWESAYENFCKIIKY